MKWAPTRNAAPASSDMLRANLAKEEAALRSLLDEQQEITEALPHLVAEPERSLEAQARLRDIAMLVPPKSRTIDAIREAIPVAEKREETERVQAQIDERLRKSAKLRRNLEARYTKAAEEFAQVIREMREDEQERGRLYLVGRPLGLNDPGQSAESALRYERFASTHSGLKSLTDGVRVLAWDGRRLDS